MNFSSKKRRQSQHQPKEEENIYSNSYKDSSNMFRGIAQVVFVWKSSVYKLLWQDCLFFAFVYFLLSFLYRAVLINYPAGREWFEVLCIFCSRFGDLIPIEFLTGFYVTEVVTRWWDQFQSLPWPESFAYKLVGVIPGKDPFRKSFRRTVMRYVNLSSILVYRLVSLKVMERFPTYESLVEAKLMMPHEVVRLRKSDELVPFESPCTPMLWAVKMIQRARKDGHIRMEPTPFATLITTLDSLEDKNRKMLNYGWMNFPLAYTQVASLTVLFYFLAALFGRQYLVPEEKAMDRNMFPHINISYSNEEPFSEFTPNFYIPYFTFVELLVYMGWIKVTDALLNPFGEDDQDFNVNLLIDKNLEVSYLIVDEAEEEMEGDAIYFEAGIDLLPPPPKKVMSPPPLLSTVGKSPSTSLLLPRAGSSSAKSGVKVEVISSHLNVRSVIKSVPGTIHNDEEDEVASRGPDQPQSPLSKAPPQQQLY